MSPIKAWAALDASGKLVPHEYDAGPLAPDEVEVAVKYCGVCFSDVALADNSWGISTYPNVPGHEVVGTVVAVGEHVTTRKVGDSVGVGWGQRSCTDCDACVAGDPNVCDTFETVATQAMVGGFADKVRVQAQWAIPLPEGIDESSAGPLFCAGFTIFHPLVVYDIKPTNSVGVAGIGGLGHLALMFANKWGCEVTAFTSSPAKAKEAKELGAHHVVDSKDTKAMGGIARSLDIILVCSSADLDWNAYITTLKPKGRLHFLGSVPSPVAVAAHTLISGQTTISGSPGTNPSIARDMLRFTKRHNMKPLVEIVPMSEVNEAMEKVRNGKPHYRMVLKN